jgi:succinate-semialdehyde dehydrogenase/glutarate-semialdehyde dehydrogenase/aspartate-semialdehyde dehydrogenase
MQATAGLASDALSGLARPDLLVTAAYFDGQWRTTPTTDPVTDPATGEVIAQVACCTVTDVDRAVAAAARDFRDWRERLAIERGSLLREWARLIRRHADDLAVIATVEQGKPLREARQEAAYAASFLDWFAAEAERTYGETLPAHKPASLISVVMQPVGVTVAITPWNFPIAMITRKAGAALAAGCTMIVKPAPEAPLSALALAKLAQDAGVPGSVLQVLTGPAPLLAERLLSSAAVRALSFTGSTEVGRALLQQAARTVKRVSMELGGHAPFVVFDDAPLDAAVRDCAAAKYATAGQDCLAANRIYVQSGHYESFVSELRSTTARLKVGHGLDSDVDIGPMTRRSVADKCRAQVVDALAKGARLVTGGIGPDSSDRFVRPTVLADVTEDMLIAREETFGPIAAVLRFEHEAEVLARANSTEMGLAAYVYTRDLNRAMRMSQQLEFGMVAINTASFTGAPIPFGGWKQSGLGREGSRHGIYEYLEPKYVCIGDLAA